MNITGEIPLSQKAAYLRTLPSVRERCGRVFELAKAGKLEHWVYHPEKEAEVIDYCVDIITRDFGTNYNQIPPHGRWRHLDFKRDRIASLRSKWNKSTAPPDQTEECKRLLDLFVISVLLDAGAGKDWSYQEAGSDERYGRSEGLAIASIHMFEDGFFSSDPAQPYRVDALALSKISADSVAQQMQVSDTNPLVGLEGRSSLLINLAKALQASPKLFGEDKRPGNLLDFLESESTLDGSIRKVPHAALWHVLIEGLNPVWPASRVSLAGIPLGDVWPCPALKLTSTQEGDDLVPFHKLTQWLTYTLMEAIEAVMGWKFVDAEDMTGLPEYRNGGLLMDLEVLTLKEGALPISLVSGLPKADATHPAIVEWRAMTVIMLDRIADSIRTKLGLSSDQLSLAQVLESATWKGGREIAKQKRPETGGPPIELVSDGTVF